MRRDVRYKRSASLSLSLSSQELFLAKTEDIEIYYKTNENTRPGKQTSYYFDYDNLSLFHSKVINYLTRFPSIHRAK